jgi:peptide-methionine (R)-S-oxide reductase
MQVLSTNAGISKRRALLRRLGVFAPARGTSAGTKGSNTSSAFAAKVAPLAKGTEAWRNQVSPAAFRVLFEKATEPAFSSPLVWEKASGTYVCAACELPLFDSTDKFDSGTGRPSFIRPLPGCVVTRADYRLIWPRTEYYCGGCGGHQGHVFNDGPPPTRQRWCNNGVALRFVSRGRALPELRN